MDLKKLIFSLFLLFISYIANSQIATPTPKYFSIGHVNKNERASALKVEANGSYYIGGMKNDSALIIKLNKNDSVLWTKTFKFNTTACYVNSLNITSDGYLIGTAVSYNNRYYCSYFKLNIINGNFIWSKTANGNNNYITKIFEKNPNEYFGVGGEYATPGTGVDTKVITIDALNGNIITQSQCIGYQPYNWLDDVEGVTDFQNNRFYSSGRLYLQNLTSKLRSNLIKYDSQGNVIWTKYLHKNASGTSRMYTRDLIFLNQSHVLVQYCADDICGGACNDYSPGLILLDTSGNVIWDKLYLIPSSNGEIVDKVCVMGNSIYITGYTNSNATSGNDVFVLKTDLNGNFQDCKKFGSPILNEKIYMNPMINASDINNNLLYFVTSEDDANGFSNIGVFKLDSTLNLTCYPGTPLTVNTLSYSPFQINYTPEYTPSSYTTSNLNNYNSILTNTCLSTISRIVDSINVLGTDTVLNVYQLNADSYNWNNGATTYSIQINSNQIDSVIISQGCCSSVKKIFYVNFCTTNLMTSASTTICSGNSTILQASGSNTYTWSPGALSSNSIVVTPTSSIIYTVTANSQDGCLSTKTISIIVDSPPQLSVTSSSICSGGSATLTASGAGNYSWSNANTLSNSVGNIVVATPTITTTYTIVGANGSCTNSIVTSVSVAASPTLTISSNTFICSGQSATLSVSGASTYSWSNASSLSSATFPNVIATPTISTNYSVTGFLNSCSTTTTVSVSVNQFPIIYSISTTTVNCGLTNGSATISSSPATYTWSNNGSITNTISNLSPGTYSVLLSNAGCITQTIVNISSYPPPTIISTNIINTTCGQANGSATVTSNSTNNTYSWSSGVSSTSHTASMLAAGIYTIMVQNGSCQTSTVITVQNSTALSILSTIISPSYCNLNNGSITVSDNQTSSVYLWVPAISPSTGTISGLPPGTYSLSINNNNCNTFSVFVVPSIMGPTNLNISTTNVHCQKDSGKIIINNVSNGTPPYLFSLNNSSYGTSLNYTNLSTGIYTISVKDVNNCVYTKTTTINRDYSTLIIDYSITKATCLGNDGGFKINSIKGGVTPYIFNFNNMGYVPDSVYENINPGIYSLYILDNYNCKSYQTINIPNDDNDYTLYIPNTFTPNNDNLNDKWYIFGTCIDDIKCTIYNRWGEKIIELNNIYESWDGKFMGKDVPEGVYVYLLELNSKGHFVNKCGHITLLR